MWDSFDQAVACYFAEYLLCDFRDILISRPVQKITWISLEKKLMRSANGTAPPVKMVIAALEVASDAI